MDTDAKQLSVDLFQIFIAHINPPYYDRVTRTLVTTDWQNAILKWANKDFSSIEIEELKNKIYDLENEIEELKGELENG